MKRIILILSLICTICTFANAQNKNINGYYSMNGDTRPFWADEDIRYPFTETGYEGGGTLEICLTEPTDASTTFTWTELDQAGGAFGEIEEYNNGRLIQMSVSTVTSWNQNWIRLRIDSSDGSRLEIKVWVLPKR